MSPAILSGRALARKRSVEGPAASVSVSVVAEHQVHEEPTAENYGEELDQVAGDLEAVEAAMRRLDDGSYGLCRHCGRDIPEEQLIGDPLTTECAEHVGSASR